MKVQKETGPTDEIRMMKEREKGKEGGGVRKEMFLLKEENIAIYNLKLMVTPCGTELAAAWFDWN